MEFVTAIAWFRHYFKIYRKKIIVNEYGLLKL